LTFFEHAHSVQLRGEKVAHYTDKQRKTILVKKWEQMAALTREKCSGIGKGACLVPFSCCDRVYCEIAARYAKQEYGVELEKTDHPTLPFMGPNGCTVAPHLRPICAIHVCERSYMADRPFAKAYFKLRANLDRLEDARRAKGKK